MIFISKWLFCLLVTGIVLGAGGTQTCKAWFLSRSLLFLWEESESSGLTPLPLWARAGSRALLCHCQLAHRVILGSWLPSSILPSFREARRRNEKVQEECVELWRTKTLYTTEIITIKGTFPSLSTLRTFLFLVWHIISLKNSTHSFLLNIITFPTWYWV